MGGRISIRIPKELQTNMQRLVRATGKSESQIVRDALEDYCRKHENEPSCYDLAVAAGIIGCGSGPPDLSTNPKYMEGFGRD